MSDDHESKCQFCNKERAGSKMLCWYLTGYHGLTGFMCGDCFDKVKHDGNGKPIHPVAYRNIMKRINRATAESEKVSND
jgi:hypothetical protein